MMKAPGKAFRKGMSLVEAFKKFPDDKTAEAWFAKLRWPDGVHCPHCDSENVLIGANNAAMPYRCRARGCRKRFSVRVGTVMQSSNLGYQTWALALYLLMTSLKSVSSMKLRRDLEITQKSAWHLAHRLRTLFEDGGSIFTGPVEADETYLGGKRKNMHRAKREQLTGRGPQGKTAVAGVKDRATNQVDAKVVNQVDGKTLQGFVASRTTADAEVYTDEATAYVGIERSHASVNHSAGEFVDGDVHTQGIDSFWGMFKRAHNGTFHKISPKHADKYVKEFAGRHNVRCQDTIDQLMVTGKRMPGRRLRYKDLIADNGLSSGARS